MDLTYGIAGVLVGGILNGSFVAPMKKMAGWKWENSGLVYSLSGLLVIPWIAALTTVPSLDTVLSGAPAASIWRVLLFGLGWGVGSVLFGLGIARMGLAVGYGLILGLIAPIGSFLPLIVLHPEQLQTRRGTSLIAGTLIVVCGIILCAIAGKMREHDNTRPKQGFSIGLPICVLAGIFSPMLNFSFAFGGELQQRALDAGATRDAASNAIWPLCLTAGLIANAGYSILLLQREGSWKLFRGAPAGYWGWGALMGLLCFGSFIVYGAGANALGSLGAVVGWPLFMSMSLITSNTLGWISGERSGAPPKAIRYAVAGMAIPIVAITVIVSGGRG
ncbi:MAG: L-rhamnose/proton symporter RhaT [Terracidiphilus sp.]|nr:L-rhamnose/proton symporter RhaT [Terracidiphilus sp.]